MNAERNLTDEGPKFVDWVKNELRAFETTNQDGNPFRGLAFGILFSGAIITFILAAIVFAIKLKIL